MARLTVFALLLTAVALGGCTVHARASAPEVVVFGPPVVRAGPVIHVHGAGCGHAQRWYAGRWVYFVSGQWEYVEGGRVYVYRTVDSRPAGVHVSRPRPVRVHGHGHGHEREFDDEDEDDDDEGGPPRRYRPTPVPTNTARPVPVRPTPQ